MLYVDGKQPLKIKWSSNAKGWLTAEHRRWFEEMLNSDYFARIPRRYLTEPDTKHIESAIAKNYLRAQEYIAGHGNEHSKFTLAQDHILAAIALEKLLHMIKKGEHVEIPKSKMPSVIEEQVSLF